MSIESIIAAMCLALGVERLVDTFLAPILDKINAKREVRKKKPFTRRIVRITAWILGGGLLYLSDLVLFAKYFVRFPIIGEVLDAVLVGGGANILHDVFGPAGAPKVKEIADTVDNLIPSKKTASTPIPPATPTVETPEG